MAQVGVVVNQPIACAKCGYSTIKYFLWRCVECSFGTQANYYCCTGNHRKCYKHAGTLIYFFVMFRSNLETNLSPFSQVRLFNCCRTLSAMPYITTGSCRRCCRFYQCRLQCSLSHDGGDGCR